jgi:transcriptional regulator with XRE-family HTH domain
MAQTGRRRGRPPIGKPNPIDIHVGQRVRQRRTLLGMSQEKLGEALNLTFQQIQKYERGANRVGSSRLFQMARVLDVPIAYFFDEMPGDVARRAKHASAPAQGFADNPGPAYEADPMTRRETLELVRAYYKITDPKVRKRLFEMTKALGVSAQGEKKKPR